MTPGAPKKRFERVLWYICVHGLNQLPRQMSAKDLAVQAGIVRKMLEDEDGISTQLICEAIQYGLPHVFPISENGYFDARDAARYLPKAKAVAATLRRQGKIPTTPEAATARIDRMAAEDEWND